MLRPVLAFVAGVVFAAIFAIGVAALAPRAHAYTFNAPTDPVITLTPQALEKFWSQQAGARGVTTDAQWSTAMNTLFSTSTSTGVDPTALAFLRSFFIQYVHVGVP